jgi:hypothetical protein
MKPLHTYCLAAILVANWATSLAFTKPIPASPQVQNRIPFSIHHEIHSRRPAPESRQSKISLQMMANPALAVAAFTGAVSGGLFAGGLHAIAGTTADAGAACTQVEVQSAILYYLS